MQNADVILADVNSDSGEPSSKQNRLLPQPRQNPARCAKGFQEALLREVPGVLWPWRMAADERRDLLKLREYPENTAGAMMTTEIAMLDEALTVREALTDLSHQAEHLETIYYIYVVDHDLHLRGVVSSRQLVSAIGKQQQRLGDLMRSDLITVNALDDREEVSRYLRVFAQLRAAALSEPRSAQLIRAVARAYDR